MLSLTVAVFFWVLGARWVIPIAWREFIA
ncbi:MAG: DUF2244 domain-containing protein, partial [Burkholderiaceae bacterium]